MVAASLKISVITVCLNAEKHIEGAIQSVLLQMYPNIEYVIVDGVSTDGTLAIIEKYKNRIHKIVSEKDRGIYDAMNKGVRLATGDVIYFLNADDRLFDVEVLSNAASIFTLQCDVDVVVGKATVVNKPDRGMCCYRPFDMDSSTRWQLLINNGICHQRLFVRRELFGKIGFFDLQYSFCADWDWIFRAVNAKSKIFFMESVVVLYNFMGTSLINLKRVYPECWRVMFKNTPFYEFLFFLIYACVRKIKTFFLRKTDSCNFEAEDE